MSTTTELKPISEMTASEIADMLEHGFEGIQNVAPVLRRAIELLRTAAHGEPSDGELLMALQAVRGALVKAYFGADDLAPTVNAAIEMIDVALAKKAPSKAGSAEQGSERDAFEKWAMPDGMQARTDAEGNYCDVGMSAGWSAWQARAALQHTAPAPSDELERLRGHLTLMPEDEAAFPDGFNVAVIRIDRYWQLREAEEKATAPSKAGEWTDERIVKAVRDAFATGRIALTFVNHEGIEKPTDVAKSFVRALSSAPAQAGAENAETQPKTRMDAVSAGGPKAAQAHSEKGGEA